MSFAVIKAKSFFQFFQANYPVFSDGCCVQPFLNSKTLLFGRIFTCKTQLDTHKNLQMHANVTGVWEKLHQSVPAFPLCRQTAFVTALHEKRGST